MWVALSTHLQDIAHVSFTTHRYQFMACLSLKALLASDTMPTQSYYDCWLCVQSDESLAVVYCSFDLISVVYTGCSPWPDRLSWRSSCCGHLHWGMLWIQECVHNTPNQSVVCWGLPVIGINSWYVVDH